MLSIRRKQFLSGIVLLLALMWSALVLAEGEHEDPTADWMPSDVDFSKAESMVIVFDDYSYEPDEVMLNVDKPYKIVFDNVGGLPHDFVHAAFFHAVVFQRIVTESGTINTPHVHSLYLRSGEKMILYLVPKKLGAYDVFCSINDHQELGMEGVFTITH